MTTTNIICIIDIAIIFLKFFLFCIIKYIFIFVLTREHKTNYWSTSTQN